MAFPFQNWLTRPKSKTVSPGPPAASIPRPTRRPPAARGPVVPARCGLAYIRPQQGATSAGGEFLRRLGRPEPGRGIRVVFSNAGGRLHAGPDPAGLRLQPAQRPPRQQLQQRRQGRDDRHRGRLRRPRHQPRRAAVRRAVQHRRRRRQSRQHRASSRSSTSTAAAPRTSRGQDSPAGTPRKAPTWNGPTPSPRAPTSCWSRPPTRTWRTWTRPCSTRPASPTSASCP